MPRTPGILPFTDPRRRAGGPIACRRRRISTPARRSNSSSAAMPAAATTSMRARWRGICRGTSQASLASWSRTCLAPAAARPRPSSTSRAPRTARRSPRSIRARSWSRCSARGRASTNTTPRQFNYLGTANNSTRVCITWHTSKTKTYADALQRATIIGSSQAGGSTRDYTHMHNRLTGTKFSIIAGYKGTVDMNVAMERGELEGICGYDFSSIKTQRPDWIRDNRLNILVQVGLEADPELTRMGVPELWKYREGRRQPQGDRADRVAADRGTALRRAARRAGRPAEDPARRAFPRPSRTRSTSRTLTRCASTSSRSTATRSRR